MKMLVLHIPTSTGSERQVAVNIDEILRMEEIEGGTTQIIQMDKGPTTVKESLADILKALDDRLGVGAMQQMQPMMTETKQPEPAPPPEPPMRGQPIGQRHPKAGAK